MDTNNKNIIIYICGTQLPGISQSVKYQGVDHQGVKLITVALSSTDKPLSELPHIFYPDQWEEDTCCQSCRRFATNKASQEEWERLTRHLEMTDRGREFIKNEFTRLLKDWYRPKEDLAPVEGQVHGGDALLVIGKVLE
ncbi:hypothetical protein DSO57_1009426 [Entomophthora muscae]|uniref:Uncharacterized protein n=1 Tax=Entomophthora muscae TaxID=34485 RepID=A0ACC2SW84_9FUNG|nr:hypothetical protein DSO57_1009426 [Entomophthora muscae]